MNRITEKDLKSVIARLNKITKSPEVSYVKSGGKYIAQVGNYHLDSAYGGHKLVRMQNEAGGISDVIHSGYVSKRELYNLIHAYMNGILEVQS